MAAILLVGHTGSVKMRTFGGRLSWTVTLVGQGGKNRLSEFSGIPKSYRPEGQGLRGTAEQSWALPWMLALTKVL